MKDLEGILVVTLEQAVAAPYASNLLAEAGARVIKIERQEGDFARNYDHLVKGESAYFVWLNRGKESVCLDVKDSFDKNILLAMLSKADVFIQNLRSGAVASLGLDYESLKQINPQIIMCSISGYGESGPYAEMKAYDLLVQAESGLSSVTGTAEGPARVGISMCDISTGMTAYAAILRSLIRRSKTNSGSHIKVSLFDVITDWMNVPLLQKAYGGVHAKRAGMNHVSIAPYGMYPAGDGKGVVFSIQNEREWKMFCRDILNDESFAVDTRFESVTKRVTNRSALDDIIISVFSQYQQTELMDLLRINNIACGRLNSLDDVLSHPQRRVVSVATPGGSVELTASGVVMDDSQPVSLPVPALGEHTDSIKAEFQKN
ncbi:MAG: crotonobetainyl-CoA:carnitine CoA-transferase CaiB-like acyl-CoA transferase [Gammaproteobacteria bacterium]|jgi:crotonobetainyl-CoA:carnitine CoA-transferase CaiB-like acyl-CoA transferase